jgi:hypothetical protein
MTVAGIISKRGRAACLSLRLRIATLKFVEIDLCGVHMTPISLMMIGVWLVTVAMRWIAGQSSLLRYVWHPALCVFAVHVFSSLLLIFDRWI